VRDYSIGAETAGGWREILSIESNYQRRRSHVLAEPVEATAIRVTVTGTNGIDHARIVEVRAYG